MTSVHYVVAERREEISFVVRPPQAQPPPPVLLPLPVYPATPPALPSRETISSLLHPAASQNSRPFQLLPNGYREPYSHNGLANPLHPHPSSRRRSEEPGGRWAMTTGDAAREPAELPDDSLASSSSSTDSLASSSSSTDSLASSSSSTDSASDDSLEDMGRLLQPCQPEPS
ncbi:hypothetical protein OUZ56_025986 [Daphnia magna]|uniref:Uncharacterized protein n=1 Tax=Daphnia magna TaxID=35525 RepID=A0ABQ9ZKI5_9CRUS|nr:hypothetical protein OUZ56_025986 [Daphnia magna]